MMMMMMIVTRTKITTVLKFLILYTLYYHITGSANNRWEDSPGGVVTGKASFAYAGAIVYNKSSNILVTHLGWTGLAKDPAEVKCRECPTGSKVDKWR